MNEMHFEGVIIKASIHANPAPLDSMIELRIIIDIDQEIMVEVIGTQEELVNLFGVNLFGVPDGASSLIKQKCRILRDGSGYHFISLVK